MRISTQVGFQIDHIILWQYIEETYSFEQSLIKCKKTNIENQFKTKLPVNVRRRFDGIQQMQTDWNVTQERKHQQI